MPWHKKKKERKEAMDDLALAIRRSLRPSESHSLGLRARFGTMLHPKATAFIHSRELGEGGHQLRFFNIPDKPVGRMKVLVKQVMLPTSKIPPTTFTAH